MAGEESDQQFAAFPEGWKTARLGDMISLHGGISYKGEFLSDTGNSLVTMGCVSASERFKKPGLKRYIGDFTERHRLRVGDMVIATRDVTQNRELLGSPALIPEGLPGEAVIAATNLYMVSNHSESPIEFLYWLMKTPAYRNQIVASAKGTTIVMLTKDSVENFTFQLPPLAEQKAIVEVLGALDDKIELNRRMNGTLEAMARALFQSWFVDFDPVRAKLDGREPVGLDKATANLFPETFEETALGHVPNGWQVKPLGEVIELAYGKPLKAEDRMHGPVCVYGANGPVGWHDVKLISGPGIVIGRKGNPGVVTWAHGDFYPIDTTFYVEPIGACRSLYFFYYALSLHNLANLSADSAVPGLNRNHAYMSKQVIPSQPVLTAFDSQIAPIFAAMHANEEQSRSLALARDTLLPKLLSGELTVPLKPSSE
jgi:type I restriction enzyme, S subunit